MKTDGWRRWIRYLAVGFGALAIAYAVKSWGLGGRNVRLRYEAPPGALQVTLYDADDQRLRGVEFAPGADRAHEVKVPAGTLRARLRLDGKEVHRRFMAGEGTVVVVKWAQAPLGQ